MSSRFINDLALISSQRRHNASRELLLLVFVNRGRLLNVIQLASPSCYCSFLFLIASVMVHAHVRLHQFVSVDLACLFLLEEILTLRMEHLRSIVRTNASFYKLWLIRGLA